MPYRRLPTTDKARLRALECAIDNSIDAGKGKSVVSDSLMNKLQVFMPKFKNSLIYLDSAKNTQIQRGKEFLDLEKRAKLYLSHFLQVVNMAIVRNELKPEIRSFYGIDVDDHLIPNFSTEAALVDWGKKIIEGDRQRIMSGGTPIYNPSIAMVRVNYERFCDALLNQKVLQANTDRTSKQVALLRTEADNLIALVWNEIEAYYSAKSDDKARRSCCEKHGVVYVTRKSEEEYSAEDTVVKKSRITKRLLPEQLQELYDYTAQQHQQYSQMNLFE